MDQLIALEAKRTEPQIIYSHRDRHFVSVADPSFRYKGVCTGLKKAYHPQGSPPVGGGGGGGGGSGDGKKKATKKVSGKKTKKGRLKRAWKSGKELGTLIDQQLGTAVKKMNHGYLTTSQYLAKYCPPGKGQKNKLVHPRTQKILQKLRDLDWQPIACQVPVCCTTTRRATNVDMICIENKTGRYVVTENKSGYSTRYMEGASMLAAPFEEIPRSLYNVHQLQLKLTSLLFRHTYGIARERVISMLLRVDDKGVQCLPPQQWIEDGEADIAKRFISSIKPAKAIAMALERKKTKARAAKAKKAHAPQIKHCTRAYKPDSDGISE